MNFESNASENSAETGTLSATAPQAVAPATHATANTVFILADS